MTSTDDLDNNSPSRHSISLHDAIDRLLSRLGSSNVDALSGVFGLWPELVGDHVAQHVSPVKLDRGRLLVEVDDPAWTTHMKFLEKDMCSELSQKTGTIISGLEIRVKSGRRAP